MSNSLTLNQGEFHTVSQHSLSQSSNFPPFMEPGSSLLYTQQLTNG